MGGRIVGFPALSSCNTPPEARTIRMNAVRIPALAPLFSAALLASCSLPGGESTYSSPFGALGVHELLVVLPPAPAAWAFLPDLRMSLSWRNPGGRPGYALAAPGSRLKLEVERGFPQAVIARPTSSGRPLDPAGALYPEGLAGQGTEEGRDRLCLDWRGGYAASIALALEAGGIDTWGYDLYRLVDGALARTSDPWVLPALEAARRLADLDFRIDAYKEPRRLPVGLPEPGPWAPESPFAAEASSSASLPEGLWRYLGASSELFVSVDSEGRAAVVER